MILLVKAGGVGIHNPPGVSMAEEIGAGLFFIGRDWLNANHFVFLGPEPALIDTGYAQGHEETLAELAALGLEPAAVKRIILTHTHADHVGSVRSIQETSACRVSLHPISRHYVETRNKWATWWYYYDHEAEFFPTHESLEDGQEVRLGAMTFQVLHLPGHAAGMIALFEPREEILLSSDALWEDDLGVLTPRIEGLDCVFRALESLDRLAGLKVRKVYPGHGRPFEDLAGAVDRARSKLERFIAEPRTQGLDQIKKIIVFTLLRTGGLPAHSLFGHLSECPWFGETISLFFGNDRPRPIFDQVIDELIQKGALTAEEAVLTAVPRAQAGF